MDRRSFLAFIPSLGAIPFIGKDIVSTPEKIEIIKPEKAKLWKPSFNYADLDLRNLELQIVQDGQVIGKGYVTQISISSPIMETSTHDIINGPRDIEVSGFISELELIPFT